MPQYLVQVRKATQLFGGRKWSNRYFVTADTLTQALDAGKQIWQVGERLFHYNTVYAYEVYANLEGDAPFTPGATATIDSSVAFGARAPGNLNDPMPEFVVARVDFAVFGSRPSRKFYRPVLYESDVEGNNLVGGIVGAMQAGIDAISSNFIVDVDNEQWSPQNGTIKGVSSRRLGRDSFISVPTPPVVEP